MRRRIRGGGTQVGMFRSSGHLDDVLFPTVQKKIDGAAKKVRTCAAGRGAVDPDAVDKRHQALTDRFALARHWLLTARGEIHACLTKFRRAFAGGRRVRLHLSVSSAVAASGVVRRTLTAGGYVLFGRAFTADAGECCGEIVPAAAREHHHGDAEISPRGERAGVSVLTTAAAQHRLAEGCARSSPARRSCRRWWRLVPARHQRARAGGRGGPRGPADRF